MAHEITVRENGIAEAMFAGKPAWHGLGVLVDEKQTPSDAMVKANIDWLVEKRGLTYRIPNEEGDFEAREATGSYATCRSDNGEFLGVVGSKYVPLQNKDQADFIEALAGEGEAVVECVGSLFKGRKVFWTCKLPDEIIIGEKDNIEEYLILVNDHAGAGSFKAFYSPVRVVCNNTLSMALSGSQGATSISIRHTGNIRSKITEARNILLAAGAAYKEAEELYNTIYDKPVKLKEDDFLNMVLNIDDTKAEDTYWKNKKNAIQSCIRLEADITQSTSWALYNGVTRYTTHAVVKDREKRFNNLLGGSSANLNRRAAEILTAV